MVRKVGIVRLFIVRVKPQAFQAGLCFRDQLPLSALPRSPVYVGSAGQRTAVPLITVQHRENIYRFPGGRTQLSNSTPRQAPDPTNFRAVSFSSLPTAAAAGESRAGEIE